MDKRARKLRMFSGRDLERTFTKTAKNNPWRLGSHNLRELHSTAATDFPKVRPNLAALQ
jgi:hypothetical protein